MIIHDKDIPGTVVRSSTIPEELGRIGYLLSDKTGTLTENEMVLNETGIKRERELIRVQILTNSFALTSTPVHSHRVENCFMFSNLVPKVSLLPVFLSLQRTGRRETLHV